MALHYSMQLSDAHRLHLTQSAKRKRGEEKKRGGGGVKKRKKGRVREEIVVCPIT